MHYNRCLPTYPIFDSGSEAVYRLARTLQGYGDRTSPRGQATREIRDMTFVLDRPDYPAATNINRNMRPAIAGAETLQLIGGFSDAKAMAKVSKQFERFMDGDELKGAYGPRVDDYIPMLVKRLILDRDSRQAVVNLYDSRKDIRAVPFKDVPCTVSFTFYIRNDELNMKTHMRSNDVWLGLPYDLVQFTQLQCTIAKHMGIDLGTYTHHVDSFHLYERDVEKVDALTEPTELGQRLNGLNVCPEDPWRIGVQKWALDLFYRLDPAVDIPWNDGDLSGTEKWLTTDLHSKLGYTNQEGPKE